MITEEGFINPPLSIERTVLDIDLPQGIYLLHLNSENYSVVKKLIRL